MKVGAPLCFVRSYKMLQPYFSRLSYYGYIPFNSSDLPTHYYSILLHHSSNIVPQVLASIRSMFTRIPKTLLLGLVFISVHQLLVHHLVYHFVHHHHHHHHHFLLILLLLLGGCCCCCCCCPSPPPETRIPVSWVVPLRNDTTSCRPSKGTPCRSEPPRGEIGPVKKDPETPVKQQIIETSKCCCFQVFFWY